MEATIQQISYAVTEARAVTNLNITVPHRKPDYKTFFPDMSKLETTFNLLNSRKKRSSNNEDEDSFKDANRKNEDQDSFKDANQKNEDEDNFKDANRKNEDQDNLSKIESKLENGRYIHTKSIKTSIFSNRTKRY
jgi:hypothetical protein